MATEEKRKTTSDNNNLERIRKNVRKLLERGRISDAFVLAKQGIEISISLTNPYYKNVFIELLDEIETANEEEEEEKINPSNEPDTPLKPPIMETRVIIDTQIEDPFVKEKESSEFVERQRKAAIETLKNQGYSVKIPSHSKGVIKNIDLIAMKIVPINDNLDAILIVPLKISQYKGIFMVDKEKTSYRLNIAPGHISSSQTYTAHAILEDSLSSISNFSAFNESFLEKKELYRMVRRFTSNTLKLKCSILLQPLYYYIGNVEHLLLIEPIFISSNVSFLDKQLNFGYQKFCNLRYCTLPQLSSMLEYLELKTEVIEGKSSIRASEKYSKISKISLLFSRLASIIVIAATILLFTGVYANLVPFDLFIFTGTGFFVLYLLTLVGLLLFMSFNSVRLARDLKTPHWKLVLNKNDSVMIHARSIFSSDLLKQFQYEMTQIIAYSNSKSRTKSLKKNSPQINRILSSNSRRKTKSRSYLTKNSQIGRTKPSNKENGDSPDKVIEISPLKVEDNTETENFALIEKFAKKYESFLK